MSTEISPQIRLIAIVGLVLAVLGGGAMFVMSPGAEAEASEPLPAPFAAQVLAPVGKAEAASAEAKERATKVDEAAAAEPKAGEASAKPAAPKAAAEPKPKPKPAPPKLVADNGLPMSIHAALQRHEVVVVSLYTPNAGVDAMALEEARAGAKGAGAGFVAVNVLDEAQGKALAELLGVQEPPAVLVYRSPDTLRFRFQGFVDLATVAQAATSARS